MQYLDGDIDQPIVTGMAYNPTKKHAYDLPAHKTRSYWKDQTHKGDGFNEIRFESERGKEEIFVHAERDRNTIVENNTIYSNAKNYTLDIGQNKFEYVNNTYKLEIGENSQFAGSIRDKNLRSILGTSVGLNSKYGKQVKSENSFLVSASNDVILSSGGNSTYGAGDRLNLTAAKMLSLISGTSVDISSEDKVVISTKNSTYMDSGKHMTINANSTIRFGNGKGFIKINDDGSIHIGNGQGSIKINANGSIDLSGPRINLN